MAYDAIKAHEYYIKYRKKGLKKGRTAKQKEKISKANKERATKPVKVAAPKNNGINKGEKQATEQAKEAYSSDKVTTLAQKKQKLQEQVNSLKEKLNNMSEDEKAQVKLELKDKIAELKRKIGRNNTVLNQFKG